MSVEYDPEPVPLARPAVLTVVFRYHDDGPTPARKWEPMPNVRLLGVSAREGPDPWEARVRYALGDPYRLPGDPQRLEQFLPYDAWGPSVFRQDDRLVALALFPDGSHEMIFSGFFQAPQGDLGAETEFVTAVVLGDTVREADNPLKGRVERDGDDPTNQAKDVQTASLPCEFNPGGRPNASPVDSSGGEPVGDSGEAPKAYPVFCGPYPTDDTINTFDVRPWTLPMAARYLYMVGARTTDGKGNYRPSKYVLMDELDYLDAVLRAVAPADDPDAGPIDPADGSTFVWEDIECPPTDCSGMPWPDALWRLIEPYGFGMGWALTEGEPADPDYPGDPSWYLDVYRKDYSRRLKKLYRQPAGRALDPGLTNTQSLKLSRDASGLANQVEADATPDAVEACYVLAPGFIVRADDPANAATFRRGNNDADPAAELGDEYRLWVFDECGEGHWDWTGTAGASLVTEPGDFAPAFLLGKKKRYWANRRRPMETHLVTKAKDGEPLRPTLWYSLDYAGDMPGVWDGTGTWEQVVSGEWLGLDDRLGVRVTCLDPDAWRVAKQGTETTLSLVTALVPGYLTAGDYVTTYVRFMVCCAVSLDSDMNVVSPRRAGSPTKFTTVRRVDVADRFKRGWVSRWSKYAKAADAKKRDVALVDDSQACRAVTDMARRSSEFGTYAGPAVVPRFTAAYSVGDQVTEVAGRGIPLRVNGAAEAGEAPVFPVVVGVEYGFDDAQTTTLTLSDARAQPPPRRGGRRGARR